eukprot:gene22011-28104_t
MGANQSAQIGIGAKSTAKEVIETFGEGKYLNGKTAIVTGGNSGIGLETVKALAFAGARVILCSRSVKAGESAIEEEVKKLGHGNYIVDASNIVVKALDLNSLASIKAFAIDFLATESRLDFLVCNAGIMALPNLEYTEAGFEKQIGVNHFGHFYLTQLLLPKMKENDQTAGRIVVLSSSAHDMGKVNPADLHYNKGRSYRGWEAYGQSKQANLLFAKSVGDKTRGTHVTAVSVHPGVIATALWKQSLVVNRVLGGCVSDKTVPQGASTTVWACVCPRVSTDELRGAYLADCAPKQPSNVAAADEGGALREALWVASETQLAEAVEKAGLNTTK